MLFVPASAPSNIRVKVIETNKEKSQRIAEVVPGNVLIINGDARDTDLLLQEGIKDAQAFIALTENASTNILACLAAKRFGVYKTIAKTENIDYIPLAESMDIGTIINKKLIAASHIYQFLSTQMFPMSPAWLYERRRGRVGCSPQFQDYKERGEGAEITERHHFRRSDTKWQAYDDTGRHTHSGLTTT